MNKILKKIFGNSGAVSTSKSITFSGLNYEVKIEKDKFEYSQKKSKISDNFYFRILLLSITEIIFYIIFRRPIFDIKFAILASMTTLVFLFLYTIIYSNSKNLRMNHGAEHKVLNAFLNHDLKNVEKYSRYSDGCGGNFSSMFILLVALSPIVKFPFTINLIYSILYSRIKIIKYLFFNTIGKATQYLTTLEPTQEILENTTKGFENLINMEVENIFKEERKIIEKWLNEDQIEGDR